MSKILLTSGSWQSALACTQSLGRHRHEISIVDELLSAPLYSRYCHGHIPAPFEKREGPYVEFLLNLVKTKSYDILIPISDTVMRYSAKHQQELGRFVRLVVPDNQTLDLAATKDKLYAFAEKQNIPIPKTYWPTDMLKVGELAQKDIFPCVVKVPVSIAGKGVFYANNQEELMKIYGSQHFDGQWPVVQEFVEGDFYGFTGMAIDGKIVMSFMYHTPREYAMEGLPPFLFSVNDAVLLEQARSIISKLGWSGAINLDFLKDPKRGYVLLEVNPRFGGTLNFAYRMGVDLPEAYCRLALGAKPQEIRQQEYAHGVMFRSIFPTEVLRCYTDKNYWKVFASNFFKLNCKTNIYWDDPGLLWGQIKETRWHWQGMRAAQAGPAMLYAAKSSFAN